MIRVMIPHRETDDELADTAVYFLSACSIDETSFDVERPVVSFTKIVSPVESLIQHVKIQRVRYKQVRLNNDFSFTSIEKRTFDSWA